MSELSCLELFTGAGGLAKGLEMAGIQHKALVEWNRDACLTLAYNYGHRLVHNVDIRTFRLSQFDHVDIVSGVALHVNHFQWEGSIMETQIDEICFHMLVKQ